jgi:hypothetical protein
LDRCLVQSPPLELITVFRPEIAFGDVVPSMRRLLSRARTTFASYLTGQSLIVFGTRARRVNASLNGARAVRAPGRPCRR